MAERLVPLGSAAADNPRAQAKPGSKHLFETRSVLRSGIAVHMVLLTVNDRKGNTFTEKKREKIMENLKDVLHASLRRGDSAARCSAQQYVVMLPRANFENSQMVCERILRAYYQKYTRVDAELRYDVFPLKPDEKENLGWMQGATER